MQHSLQVVKTSKRRQRNNANANKSNVQVHAEEWTEIDEGRKLHKKKQATCRLQLYFCLIQPTNRSHTSTTRFSFCLIDEQRSDSSSNKASILNANEGNDEPILFVYAGVCRL